MSDLPIINCSFKDFLLTKNRHGKYITERATYYYDNGKRHRLDGPAVEFPKDHYKYNQYYIDSFYICDNKEDFYIHINNLGEYR